MARSIGFKAGNLNREHGSHSNVTMCTVQGDSRCTTVGHCCAVRVQEHRRCVGKHLAGVFRASINETIEKGVNSCGACWLHCDHADWCGARRPRPKWAMCSSDQPRDERQQDEHYRAHTGQARSLNSVVSPNNCTYSSYLNYCEQHLWLTYGPP